MHAYDNKSYGNESNLIFKILLQFILKFLHLLKSIEGCLQVSALNHKKQMQQKGITSPLAYKHYDMYCKFFFLTC